MQVLKCDYLGNSLVAQQLKDPALSLLRLKLLLWHGFDLWYRNFGMLWMQAPPPQKKYDYFNETSFLFNDNISLNWHITTAYPFLSWLTFELFPLSILNNVASNICGQAFV